jgi:capsular polysaccharide export protein
MKSPRRFLMLQGVCSPFFKRLADRLVQDGHRVLKVNFNVGDRAYWGRHTATDFRDRLAALPDFIDELFKRHDITDQIVFGDCRPVHEPAIARARAANVRNHVFEEGYFRPHWITLEREGTNKHSRLPRDAEWFRRTGATLPDRTRGSAFSASFWKRAVYDVAYHSASAWNPLLYPHYRTHAPARADQEYLSYLRRFARVRQRRRQDHARLAALVERRTPFFLLPLQLDSDAQIRIHSGFADMTAVVSHVLDSFVRAAHGDAHLLVKNHPLDNGLLDYAHIVAELADRRGIAGRVHYIESGDLYTALHHARGTVTVNSTVGISALAASCPTFALGDPIYKLPGLTADGALDAFWRAPARIDRELFRSFRNVVIHMTQVHGGFYSSEGIALAVENSLRPLTENHPLLEPLT